MSPPTKQRQERTRGVPAAFIFRDERTKLQIRLINSHEQRRYISPEAGRQGSGFKRPEQSLLVLRFSVDERGSVTVYAAPSNF